MCILVGFCIDSLGGPDQGRLLCQLGGLCQPGPTQWSTGGTGDMDPERLHPNYIQSLIWNWLLEHPFLAETYGAPKPWRVNGPEWATGVIFYDATGRAMIPLVFFGDKDQNTNFALMRGDDVLLTTAWDDGALVLTRPGGPVVCAEPDCQFTFGVGQAAIRVVKRTWQIRDNDDMREMQSSIAAQIPDPDRTVRLVNVVAAPVWVHRPSWGELKLLYR
jgi:hypothetical protein